MKAMRVTAVFSVLLALMIAGWFGYWLGMRSHTDGKTEIAQRTTSPTPGSYYVLMPQDCQNTDIADATACIWGYASSTEREADMLAKALVAGDLGHPEAPVPGYSVFGGTDFVSDLSIGVRQAGQTQQGSIAALCKLDSMTLYGGSGIELEQGACVYYYDKLYLDTLKSLEAETIATST